MALNMTFTDTADTFVDVITGLNASTNGYLAAFIVFSVGIIMLISMKARFETKTALLASGFVTTLIASLMWGIGWINFGYIFIPAVAIFAGLIMHAWRD